MRVAVVYIPSGSPDALAALAKAMTRSLEAKGHFVDLSLAGADEAPRLTGYDYVIVGTEPSSAFGKIPDKVAKTLAQSGSLSGKRSMAFLRKGGLMPDKALARLMKAMEAEGMVVNSAEVLANAQAAEAAAAEAPIERY
jgi:hypothetical protein